MRLTRYTDYAIRVLIYLGTREGQLSSIREIAMSFGISQNHLMKVAQDLAADGFVESVRGRNGGLRLARAANQINLGAVLRSTEALDELVACDGCIIARRCDLPPILAEATKAFVSVFEKYTVADLVGRGQAIKQLLSLSMADQAIDKREDAPIL